MKKVLSVSLVMLVFLSGCSFSLNISESGTQAASPGSSSDPSGQAQPSAPAESSVSRVEVPTLAPDKAVQKMLDSFTDLENANIEDIAGQYFGSNTIPETYFCVLKPILERVTYKTGSYKIDGDNAVVDVAVTAVDAQSAINSIMPGALSHLAVMQLMGKDVSNPEKILAEYAAKNIEWDSLSTIKTNTTLYLVKGADGEWKVDMNNPDNIAVADAISGGAITAAQNIKSFAERFQ